MSEQYLNDVFTAAQASAAGVTPARLRTKAFRRIYWGVYARAGCRADVALRSRAALLLFREEARISHTTGAQLIGLPVPSDPQIHVSVPDQRDRRHREGIRCHVNPSSRRWLAGGIPVSTGPDVLCELASRLSLVDLVVAGDALAGPRFSTSPDILRARAERYRGPDARLLRRAISLVRTGVESPMETRLRLLVVFAGFPEPRINVRLQDGGAHKRPDLAWPELRLGLEYDGAHHWDDLDQRDRDIRRREWFNARKWTVLTMVSRDIYQRPEKAIQRVHAAWLRCGGPRLVLKDEWREHFTSTRG